MSSPLSYAPIFDGSLGERLFGGVFIILVGLACVTDVRARRIPNSLVLVLALAGIVFSLMRFSPLVGLRSAFAGMGVGLGIWIGFYALGVLGAGDVKFFAAAAAWLGPAGAWRAALVAAAAGGVLAVLFLVKASRLGATLHRLALMPFARRLEVTTLSEMSRDEARRQLPYGLALAVGVVVMAMFPAVLS